ncbi:insulinase family protein [Paraglaciecola sp. L3A3]|uniref:insulinase family protein n=1 Tax=Paraglaciecola sp. L3A3 TaxID=2686358 RepID=UPI00131E3AB6|nr:insulinase family protein [Paraglaciecola sp. L3A3]
MRIFLIQDVNYEKSACALSVNSGHFNDPDDCHGLSHLLEHMLFLGNNTFVEPNEFVTYLSSMGGHINALTGTEYTSYFLDSTKETEVQAIKRLYSMTTSPIFAESLISEEIKAIDAEFSLKQKDEIRRLYQVHKETCNPLHPFSKFSVGNKHTFSSFSAKQLKNKLQKLHQQFYQPQNICLCWISPTDLDLRKDIIMQGFASWKNTCNLPSQKFPPLYLTENLAIKISIKPLQKAQRLIISFALPNPKVHFRSKPLSILSHLLGDEGENSLLEFLKNKGWATSLNAGGGIEGKNFRDFNINIQLTEQGIQYITDIINALFSFIDMIKKNGIELWRIKELATIKQQEWDYSEPEKPIDQALHISQSMFEYSEEYVLAGDFVIDDIRPNLPIKLLELFKPEHMRIKLIHPDVSTSQIANWYHTPYQVEKIDKKTLGAYTTFDLDFKFNLAQPNPFIIEQPKIQSNHITFDVPKPIVQQTGLNLWYGQDNKFKQPKGDCFLTFDCAAVNEGIELVSAKRLWIGLLNEKLNKRYYQAELAGMNFHFYPHQGGFSLQTNGFSGNQLAFCSKLLTQIVFHEDFTQSFKQIKNRQLAGLSNALLNKPINSLFSRLAVLMQQHNYLPLDMAKVLQNMAPEDIYQTKIKLLSQFHLEGLMYGNWNQSEATNISHKIKEFRNNHSIGAKVNRGVADIRQQPTITHKVQYQHQEPAVVIYFQAPDPSPETVALTILTEQLVASPFFNEIRTEQQLGYLVGSGYIPYNSHPGLAFYIQSPHTEVPQLILAIYNFLEKIMAQIDQYKDIWQSLKQGVIKQITEKDSSLSMKSRRFWMAIGNKDYNFSQTDKMVQIISDLDMASLKKFLSKLVNRDGFGEIILHNSDLNAAIIEGAESQDDPREFKSRCCYLTY